MASFCDGCGRRATAGLEIVACDECQRLLTAFMATLKHGEFLPGAQLSAQRKLALTRLQQMAKELTDATIGLADQGLTDAQLAQAFVTIEGLWAVLRRPGASWSVTRPAVRPET